jgi:DNA invertase Pin-like site-specific DNA recombinase
MYEAVRRLRPDQAIEAAGYVRVSLDRQKLGHSPEVQRDALKKLAAEQGFALTMVAEDHERGSKVSRTGYQQIIESVRAGTTHAVLVFCFDRWGRDGAEWLARAQEFDRLGVPIISAQEGKDERGMMRFVRAGMYQWFSEQLAEKVRPNREAAARNGTHMGATPIGYVRDKAQVGANGRPLARPLLKDPERAWVVQELFRRYAAGGWSSRDLAHWCNSDPRCGPSPDGALWRGSRILNILKNPIYLGKVRYNVRPQGLYERAAPDSAFVTDGQHEPLVDQATFDEVQRRLTAARTRPTYNRGYACNREPVALGTDLLHCTCGATMFRQAQKAPKADLYLCNARRAGLSQCMAQGYSIPVADTALLAEVRRLRRGMPWTPQAEQQLLGADGSKEAETVAALQQELKQAKDRLRKNALALSMMDGDPTPEAVAAFQEAGAAISAHIRKVEAQIATTGQKAARLPSLKLVHQQLAEAEISTVVDTLAAQGDTAGLRELVQTLVESAALVERYPTHHTKWARMAVTWTEDVQTLLQAGLLSLDAPAPRPAFPTRADQQRGAKARYRARKRAARLAERGNTEV